MRKGNSYVTNENGVLAPVLNKGKNGSWLEVAHVDKIDEDDNNEKLSKLLSHNGKNFSWNDIRTHLKMKYLDKHYIGNSELENHPLVKKFKNLMDKTDISPFDFTEKNIGIWKHPITKKEHVVLLDYGASKKLLNQYDTATENYINKIKIRVV